MIQPPASLHDTQPNPTARRRKRERWLLAAVIAATSCTLALTLALLFASLAGTGATEIQTGGRQVTVRIDGAVQRVHTSARTIADMLREQRIEVSPADALSHDLSAPLDDGMNITIKRARAVRITLNGSQQTVNTALDNPLDILRSADIEVSSDDRIRINGAPADLALLSDWTIPAQDIDIRQPAELRVVDDGRPSKIITTADTIGEALFEADIRLYLTDEITPPLDAAIVGAMTVTIDRALPVALRVDGVRIEARTQAETVDAVLAELNAPLFGLDYVMPTGETPVSENMTIEIVRVTEEVAVQTETIPYQRRYQADADIPLDEKAVIQIGRHGSQEIRSRVRYENGIQTGRTITETVIVEAPVDEVMGYGTKIVLKTVQTPAGPREYWRALRMYATSYHPAALGGDSTTAIGAALAKGIVAADPKIIPYRTELFVPRYGIGLMADTGGRRSSPYWIDLGYSDEDWVSWSGYVDVYLLTPVPAKVDYLLPEWTPLRNRPDS